MMTISLPIPKRKETKEFFFLPYDIKQGYMNFSYKIRVGGSDNLRTLRNTMQQTYGLNPGSFVIAAVYNNSFSRLHTTSANLLEVADEQGATLMYEIPASLNPSLPNQAMRQDAMYNISPDYTMLQLQIACWQQAQYRGMEKNLSLPRLLWVTKKQTLKQLHMTIFKHVRYIFSEWADITDPDTKRTVKNNLRNLIAFPFKKQESDPQMTKE